MDLIGYIAGFLTTLSFLPQVIKAVKYGSTKDISLTMYSMLCTGILMWLVYGFAVDSWPIIISNGVTLVLAGAVLVMKVRCG